MKYTIGFLMLAVSAALMAKPYLALNWTDNLTVVLMETPCQVNGKHGSHAEAQWSNGSTIQGCWRFVDDYQHVRIEWNNPMAPNDFAVLRFGDFKLIEPKEK
jgi:hypothetical protein